MVQYKKGISVREAFDNAPYLSQKLESYFAVYEDLFGRFKGTDCTFMEIGILHGGSLFMWREFLGPKARIIGIDLNPSAIKWRDHGFEIYVGSQSDSDFWEYLKTVVQDVDVILDDGGHTNEQQMCSVIFGSSLVKDGGLLVVEDTHASFWPNFGNPSKYSFSNFAHGVSDDLTKFGREEKVTRLSAVVSQVRFFPSITAFVIDRKVATEEARAISNLGMVDIAPDMRFHGSNRLFKFLIEVDRALSNARNIGESRKWLRIFNPLISLRAFAMPRKLLKRLVKLLMVVNLRITNFLSYCKLLREFSKNPSDF